MTEQEKHLISAITQAKANIECEDVKVSSDCIFQVLEKNIQKQQCIQTNSKQYIKRKELKYEQ